ncbi:alanine racemase [Pontibacter burrus]|uniref:Alanine racemase n=1 Tax=Pontibacter burrus TaxID=2704466 RepID=A0A6B3LTK6_9BACT|nr:alanine racemase [Pontibacter burrus]NEM99163.1 alanine racemase [Pontibacter burrus]
MKITVPTLLLDKEKCLRNIRLMVEKARRNGLRLRPHFKTHQSAQVGEWFRQEGVEAITVSSVRMARYFANHGWTDIMVAIPVNVLELETINELASRVRLHLIVVNEEVVPILQKGLNHKVAVWLKIDTGYHRTGIPATNYKTIDNALQTIAATDKLEFQGFMAHDGHTYKQTDAEAIRAIHQTTVDHLNQLLERYKGQFQTIELSIGDTPSCSILETIVGVDEIRPGNFVFYDLTQQHIGSNTYNQIAVCMACPVIAKHSERNEIILYGGSVHFSKDVLSQSDGSNLFGRVVAMTGNGWTDPVEGINLVSLSQEHGILKATDEQFANYSIGDIMYILPIHSCLTADSMKSYLTLEGERLEHLAGLPESYLQFPRPHSVWRTCECLTSEII